MSQTDNDTTGTDSSAGADTGKDDKAFTQADLDRIVKERVAREKAKFADYDDLKQRVTANESEQEKAVREAAEKARDEALSEVGQARLADRVQVAAAKKLNDPADAVRLLDLDGLDPFDPKTDAEIGARIDKLVKDKPYLAVQPGRSGSNDAGSKGGSAATTGVDMNSMIRRAAGRN